MSPSYSGHGWSFDGWRIAYNGEHKGHLGGINTNVLVVCHNSKPNFQFGFFYNRENRVLHNRREDTWVKGVRCEVVEDKTTIEEWKVSSSTYHFMIFDLAAENVAKINYSSLFYEYRGVVYLLQDISIGGPISYYSGIPVNKVNAGGGKYTYAILVTPDDIFRHRIRCLAVERSSTKTSKKVVKILSPTN
jgi:hypothetical protein